MYDSDKMWLGSYVNVIKANYNYKDVPFYETVTYYKDTKSIIVEYFVPEKPVPPKITPSKKCPPCPSSWQDINGECLTGWCDN